MEVLEEEEIKRLQATKQAFEEKRDALIADAQRLEAATQVRATSRRRMNADLLCAASGGMKRKSGE